jgi:5'(3')-deoxyribonucleotidase
MGRLFLDCDGVLANFDKLATEILGGMYSRDYEEKFGTDAFYAALDSHGSFFKSLELLPDALELFDAVKHLHPIILTGAPMNMPSSFFHKIDWIEEKFGINQRFIICQSKNKFLYCSEGDIIVDDWPKHSQKWIDQGGIWVHHDNAKSSIDVLKNLGII